MIVQQNLNNEEGRDFLKRKLINWNNKYPFDRAYRKKHSIGFGTEEHRALNFIDVYMDILEEQIIKEGVAYWDEFDEKKKLYDQGIWLREREVTKEQEDDLFSKIDLSQINSK